MRRNKMFILNLMVISMAAVIVSCAAHRPAKLVQAGDIIQVSYTCRTSDNSIAVTTDQKIAEDRQFLKSPIFLSSSAYGPVELTAEHPEKCKTCKKKRPKIKGFSEELNQQIAEAVIGWAYGECKTIHLTAKVPEGLTQDARYISLAKIRRRPKIKQVSRKLFIKSVGKTPEPGMDVPPEEGFTSRVVAVEGDQVTIRITAEPGTQVKTPFGMGTISDRGSLYEIDIDVKEGDMMRSGDMVGKVVKIKGRMFYLDFGQPFGGEELFCDVKICEKAER